MEPGEEKKGRKRKYEKGEKGKAKKRKQMQTYASSTSSETTQDDQAQKNVRKRDWFRHCSIDQRGVKPKCTVCNEHHSFYINPTTFKKHLATKHPRTHIIEDEPDWIFRYFKFVKQSENLKCKECQLKLKVLKFKGPFVDHFVNDEEHIYGKMVKK